MRRRLYILLTMILVGVTIFAQTLKVKGTEWWVTSATASCSVLTMCAPI